MNPDPDVVSLRGEVAQLRAELESLRSALPNAPTAAPRGPIETSASSRRDLLRFAAVGAAAAAGVVIGEAGPAAAALPDQLNSSTLTTTTNTTEISYHNTIAPDNHVLWVQDGGRVVYPESAFPRSAAISGWASYGWVEDGVQGVTETIGFGGNFEGRGATDLGSATGIRITGVRAAMLLVAKDANSIAAPFDRVPGEVLYDSSGNLWLCVGAGTPGTWTKLGGPTAAGAFHPIVPVRVHDSRKPGPTPGALSDGQSRVISVKNGRDIDTGVANAFDVVPDGATAIAYNLTVVGTVGGSYLAVNPGGVTSVTASSINWTQSDQTIANGLVVKIAPDRTVTVVCGPNGAAHFLIDVLGYYR